MLLLFLLFGLLGVCVKSFCNMNAIDDVEKYGLLNSKPSSLILINNMIKKYSEKYGIPVEKIKSCIQNKKALKLKSLRGSKIKRRKL